MALEFYVEQADRSPHSGLANEVIEPGELVHDDGAGVDVLTFADDASNAGLARFDAQAFAREHDDQVVPKEYDPSEEMRNRVQYQPFEDSAVVKVKTPKDNGTDPAPSVSHRTVVGIVDAAGGTVSSAGEFQGRIVEEGYTDDAATTYDRSSGNFKAIGVAYRPAGPLNKGGSVSEFDDPIRVVLFSEPQE
jgi:hypothetical protein